VAADLKCGLKGMKVSSPQKKCVIGKFRLKAKGLPKAPEPARYTARSIAPVNNKPAAAVAIKQPPPGPNKPVVVKPVVVEAVKKIVIPAKKAVKKSAKKKK
jgi:hypothetical protein